MTSFLHFQNGNYIIADNSKLHQIKSKIQKTSKLIRVTSLYVILISCYSSSRNYVNITLQKSKIFKIEIFQYFHSRARVPCATKQQLWSGICEGATRGGSLATEAR